MTAVFSTAKTMVINAPITPPKKQPGQAFFNHHCSSIDQRALQRLSRLKRPSLLQERELSFTFDGI